MPPGDARRAATFLFRVRGRLDRVVASFASMDLREPRQLNGSHLRDISSEEPWFVRKAWAFFDSVVGRYSVLAPCPRAVNRAAGHRCKPVKLD